MAGAAPVAAWRAAREASVAALTPQALTRMTSIPGHDLIQRPARVVAQIRTALAAGTSV